MANDKGHTLRQAAQKLGVSQATIRNWIKAGRLAPVRSGGQEPFFRERELNQLARAIESGKLPYLRSRRNKRALKSSAVPVGYLTTNRDQELVEHLLHQAREICSEQRLILLILEVYLRLLKSKGCINCSNQGGTSLTFAWLKGKISLGVYTELAAELLGLLPNYSMEEIEKLNRLTHVSVSYQAGQDLLGLIYMSLSSLGIRNQTGTYYTPTKILTGLVQDCTQRLSGVEPRIVDPCCGSGNFLIALFIWLKERLLADGLTMEQAEEKIIGKLLSGFDIDPIAVQLAKMNISLLLEQPELIGRLQIHCQDTLRLTGQGHYDLIIGNPPWGYKYQDSELKFFAKEYQTARGGVESFNLFLEWAVEHTVDTGIIGFVLPEAFLTVKAHAPTRRFLVERGAFKQINRLGQLFPQANTPVISLVYQKGKVTQDTQVTIKEQNRVYQLSSQSSITHEHGYAVFANPMERKIIEHITQAPQIQFLRNNADFALGIVTGNNRKFIRQEPASTDELVIRGKDVYKYWLRPGTNYLDSSQLDNYQQVAPEEFYRAPEKLIYRFVGRYLVFAYDDRQLLTLNSANIVIPRIKDVDIKYLLAVLNSRVLQFYHQVAFQSVKVLRKHLETLPLCCPNIHQQKPVIRLVEQMLANPNNEKDLLQKTYNEIDQILMEYYRIPTEFQIYIKKRYPQVKFL